MNAVRRTRGAAAAVARELGVYPSLVSMVLAGKRQGKHGGRTVQVVEAIKRKAAELTRERHDG